MRRPTLLALTALVSLSVPAWSSTAHAAPTPPTPVTSTQAFTGGGTASVAADGTIDGSYTSNGQMGSGSFHVHSGPVNGFPPLDGIQPTKFTRSDGVVLRGIFAPSNVTCEREGVASDCRGADLEGAADIAEAHFYLAVSHTPQGFVFLMKGTLKIRRRIGYVMEDGSGRTYAFGGIDHLSDAPTVDATDIELTPSYQGEWIVNGVGIVSVRGNAGFFGNANRTAFAPGERVTALSSTPTGKGYWLFTTRGRALPLGDAKFFGDLHSLALNGPVVGSIATPTGLGYYMVGSDGGVFAFGDAQFRGSMGNVHLNQPVVGLVPTATNTGYWLVASDGGVFSFGAPFRGSMGGTPLNRPIVTMVPYGGSYLMIASDGGTFSFSTAPFFGSRAGVPTPAPVVSGAATG